MQAIRPMRTGHCNGPFYGDVQDGGPFEATVVDEGREVRGQDAEFAGGQLGEGG
ncbi:MULTISPECIES: hypothetical protein [Streptomyces]|uniref:hypothetical protein n=1 Tax=Streptomyces TaxID=1883 RepID=UPI0029318D62|nr:hypothetical protein [Streptomyces sp. NEAU-HV9]